MAISSSSFNQVVLAEQELLEHYRFRLCQVGLSYPEACKTAALMLQAPNDLTETELTSINYALLILENHRISNSLKVRGRAPIRLKPHRRSQKKYVLSAAISSKSNQNQTFVT